MKYIHILLLFIIFSKTNGQTILSLYSGEFGINGAYYKDLDHDLDKFVGTWKYTNGTTSLTITFQKKEMQQRTNGSSIFYEDFIVGEYRYIENNVEKINTLPQLSLNLELFKHNLVGNILYSGQQRSIKIRFKDPNFWINGMTASMFVERADNGGIQKLKISFRMTDGPITVQGEPLANTQYTVPFGDYLLVKQP